MPLIKDYLTVAQASEELGISRKMIYELCKTRRIGFLKLGHRMYFAPDDLKSYLNSLRIPPQDPSRNAGLKHLRTR